VAGIIHAFHRQAKYVKIGAMFAMLNAAAPPLLTTLDTLVYTPVFYILRYIGSFPERREYSPKPNVPVWGRQGS